MKALITPLLAFACFAGFSTGAAAESILMTEAWVKVLAEPAPGGKAIGLAYGNDRYELLEEGAGWYRIMTSNGRTGWVPATTAYPVIRPIATKALGYANSLRTTGRGPLARAKFFEILKRFPDSVYSYEAVQRLLTYHPVGELPAMENGKVPPGGHEQVAKLMPRMLIEEGRQLLAERRHNEAVSMFEEARTKGVVNLSAMDGIREALQREMRIAQRSGDLEHIRVMTIALRDYFPGHTDRTNFRFFDSGGFRVGAPRPRGPVRPTAPIRPAKPLQYDDGADSNALDMAPIEPTDGDGGTDGEPMDEGMQDEPMEGEPMDDGMDDEPMDGDGTMEEEAAASEPAESGPLPMTEPAGPTSNPAAAMQTPPPPAGPAATPPVSDTAPRQLPPAAMSYGAGNPAQAVATVEFGPAARSAGMPQLPLPPPSLRELQERPAAQAPAE